MKGIRGRKVKVGMEKANFHKLEVYGLLDPD